MDVVVNNLLVNLLGVAIRRESLLYGSLFCYGEILF